MGKAILLAATLGVLAACESEAHKLERLRSEEAIACRPIFVADSTEAERDAVVSRIQAIEANGYDFDPEEASAYLLDIEHRNEWLRADSAKFRRLQAHPEEAAAEAKAMSDSRTKCDLAMRAMNLFMAGK